MVMCQCGKEMDVVPNWFQGVDVQFVCNNCPNQTIKGITEVDLAAGLVPVSTPDTGQDKGDEPAPELDDDEDN
ncbi:MAG TPA: hypothetical protein PLB31_00605 [Fimbriimonadaceae bacterium]|nr:hypothetical protein [Armatimonadota bacterium]HRI72950.1 hypothetical protein [Fimbriimonadaceae bacterium]